MEHLISEAVRHTVACFLSLSFVVAGGKISLCFTRWNPRHRVLLPHTVERAAQEIGEAQRDAWWEWKRRRRRRRVSLRVIFFIIIPSLDSACLGNQLTWKLIFWVYWCVCIIHVHTMHVYVNVCASMSCMQILSVCMHVCVHVSVCACVCVCVVGNTRTTFSVCGWVTLQKSTITSINNLIRAYPPCQKGLQSEV